MHLFEGCFRLHRYIIRSTESVDLLLVSVGRFDIET